MALTEIARKLKETFSGFAVSGLKDELEQFRNTYRAAESISIGSMDYIVINDVYKNEEYDDVPETTSPLFYNSINNKYAIIDAETSSTLIDEVYSLITYMQRDCEEGARLPTSDEIRGALGKVMGSGESIVSTSIVEDDGDASPTRNRANIFQCQLVKDTGVSASPDVYSFMLKDGKPKEIPDSAIRMDSDVGKLSMLDDSNIEELKLTEPQIQQAVFDKYQNSDIDIQSVTVKSIFETKMKYCDVHLLLQGNIGRNKVTSVFKTSYLTSQNNEFATLNENIHICNCCKSDLVDVIDASKIYRLHANLDAYDEPQTMSAVGKKKNGITKADLLEKIVYTAGCEKCMIQCPECNGWHFNYQELAPKSDEIYDSLKLAPGRAFIKGIRDYEINFCTCREAIEWVYDDFSGTDDEHDVIPIEKMAFFNYASEKLKDFRDYKPYLDRIKNSNLDATAKRNKAVETLAKYKDALAREFNIEVSSIKISSADKCNECCVCGGLYYGRLKDGRCAICSEMFDENRHMVTRVDGIVFMISGTGKKKTISRYVVTKLGNLKLIGTPKTIENFGTADELEIDVEDITVTENAEESATVDEILEIEENNDKE